MDDLLGPDENSGNPIGSEATVIDPFRGESATLNQQAISDDLLSDAGNMDPSELSSIDSDIIDLPDLGFGGDWTTTWRVLQSIGLIRYRVFPKIPIH